jgi:hypothetical protein
VKFTRRKNEIAQVVALLESDGFDSAEDLAYAVLKAAAEALCARELYTVETSDAPQRMWGLYASRAEAVAAWRGATSDAPLERNGRAGVHQLNPIEKRRKFLIRVPSSRDLCGACGHERWVHTSDGTKGGCGLSKATRCHCAAFV